MLFNFFYSPVKITVPVNAAGRQAVTQEKNTLRTGNAHFVRIERSIYAKIVHKIRVSKCHAPKTGKVHFPIPDHAGSEIGGELAQVCISRSHDVQMRKRFFDGCGCVCMTGKPLKGMFRRQVRTIVIRPQDMSVNITNAAGDIE